LDEGNICPKAVKQTLPQNFCKGRGKIVFGRDRKGSNEHVKQTNIAAKLLPYIDNLDSGEPYFSSKAMKILLSMTATI